MNKKNHGFLTKGQIKRKKAWKLCKCLFTLSLIPISCIGCYYALRFIWSITWGKVI